MSNPTIYNNDYYTKAPCKVKVYGCNDYVESTDPTAETGSWKELGYYNEDPNAASANRWYTNKETGYNYDIQTLAAMEAADPAYLSLSLDFDGNEYRYFRIEVLDTYENLWLPSYYHNNDGYVSFHEIEVFAKKELMMRKNLLYIILPALFVGLFSACESLEDTYSDYTGDGPIRYLSKAYYLEGTPGWEEVVLNWENKIDAAKRCNPGYMAG